MKYLDSNIPLELILKKSGQKESCMLIMEALDNEKERAITSAFTIAEIYHVLTLREKFSSLDVKKHIESLISCKGLQIIDFPADICTNTVDLAVKFNVDFVDAGHKLLMDKYQIKEIYSLDRHFDKFNDIKRLTVLK